MAALRRAGLAAPLFFKRAVDALSAGAGGQAAVGAAVAALLASGLCKAGSGLAKELQHPTFTPVSQARCALHAASCLLCCAALPAEPSAAARLLT